MVIAILFMIYFDPLGLQTPNLLKELRVLTGDGDEDIGGEGDNKKKGLYRASTWRLWGQRAKVLCCCVRGKNNASKAQALEDIAHAMATMFDDIEIVPTDFIAGLVMVYRDQKEQLRDNPDCDLGTTVKEVNDTNLRYAVVHGDIRLQYF